MYTMWKFKVIKIFKSATTQQSKKDKRWHFSAIVSVKIFLMLPHQKGISQLAKHTVHRTPTKHASPPQGCSPAAREVPLK